MARLVTYLSQVAHIARRECLILLRNPICWFCMVVFPLLVMFFFTSMMGEGVPVDMPVGVVDMDNTSTSRQLVRRLDAFQTSRVVARYPTVGEARRAIQRNEIYAFLYIPRGTTDKLLASRRPPLCGARRQRRELLKSLQSRKEPAGIKRSA